MSFIAQISISAVMLPMAVVAYTIGFVASWFVTLGGTLTNWALNLNSSVLTSITVKTGWVVSRDIANLGFVLAIILIAFITILRYQSYDTKKMLVRLISAALLINFSLVIAGVFIDFSGTLTNFFLSKATSGNISQIGPGLVGSLRAHELFQQKADEATVKNQIEGMGGDFNKFIVFLATQAFIGIFTTITAISLLSLATMFMIRYIALTLLLILMPIAWLMWIWPDLDGYWSSWWKQFMKWCFFAPAMSFFIYLAFQVALSFKGDFGSMAGVPVSGVGDMGILIQNFSAILGQMVSVLGILYGGIYVANAMGIAGASLGISAVGMAKGYITGAPGATGGYIASKYGMGGLNRISTSFGSGKTVNERLRSVTASLSGVPLVGDAFQDMNARLKKSGDESMADFMKKYDSMDPEARKNALSGWLFKDRIINPEERAGAMASMAKNNQMKDMKETLGPKLFDEFAQSAISRGGDVAKALIGKDAELARHLVNVGNVKYKGLDEAGLEKARTEEVLKAYEKIAGEDAKNVAIESLTLTAEEEKLAGIERSKVLLRKIEKIGRVRNNFLTGFAERGFEDKEKLINALVEQIKNLSLSGGEPALLNNLKTKMTFLSKSPAWAGSIDDERMKSIGLGEKEKTAEKKVILDSFGQPIK